MQILATNESKPRELVPEGNYIGRCFKMVYMGTIDGKFGKAKKVYLSWELPTEMKVWKEGEAAKPSSVNKEYTLSTNPKSNLGQDLVSWRGKAFTTEEAKVFDIVKVLGHPCMVNLIHNPSKSDPNIKYEKISTITPMPKGLEAPAAINDQVVFSVLDFDQSVFDSLPEFLQNKIKESDEYKALNDEAIDAGADPIIESDDLPF